MMEGQDIPKAPTGVPGLDHILNGGLPQGQFILLQGGPGTGKTTLALQFLREGGRRGKRSLYITFLHARRDIQRIADSHGWDLEGITIEELPEAAACNQTIFPTSEVELGETINAINEVIERVSPERLVFDSVSELQMISDTVFRCRREVASLKRLLTTRKCTALFTIGESPGNGNEFEHTTDGLILLKQSAPSFGAVRRTLEVVKMRGMPYMTGRHDFRIKTGGLEIFPSLHASGSRIRQSPIEVVCVKFCKFDQA